MSAHASGVTLVAPRPRQRQASTPAATPGLLDQLVRDYQYLGARRITQEIDAAIRDLQASVSRDALPEMVIRLASHRLGKNTEAAR